ncbi:MAG: acyl carrier protein [Pseudomonadota bacterium]
MNRLIELLKELFPGILLDNWDDLGVGSHEKWDSLGHFNFMMDIEEEFGITFSTEEITEIKKLNQIISILKTKGKILE